MNYDETIRSQVDEFVTALKTEFDDAYDWVDALDSNSSLGLDHLDEYDDAEAMFNQNPLEVSMGVSIDSLSLADVDELDGAIHSFADQQGVTVKVTEGASDFTVYTFYLHGAFLDVPR